MKKLTSCLLALLLTIGYILTAAIVPVQASGDTEDEYYTYYTIADRVIITGRWLDGSKEVVIPGAFDENLLRNRT